MLSQGYGIVKPLATNGWHSHICFNTYPSHALRHGARTITRTQQQTMAAIRARN
jgi:hypothetical protein